MVRYNRDERSYDRDKPRGEDSQSSEGRRRFPWDDPAADPAETSDPAPEWTEPPIDPDSGSPEALEEARTESVPEDVGAGEPDASGAPEEFPWHESAGADRPSPVWEEQAADDSRSVGTSGATSARSDKRNSMAIAGFVLSLVMWIPFPRPASVLNVLLWVMALTFSSIGLSRSRKRGLPQKGLAIAGLCISLIGVVLIIILAILFTLGVIGLFG